MRIIVSYFENHSCKYFNSNITNLNLGANLLNQKQSTVVECIQGLYYILPTAKVLPK